MGLPAHLPAGVFVALAMGV
uniref:Uncharacterized protein n=1 Tax=Arundo donax TaxID=35708 RepID=A0A0A8XN48_ARUDO